MAFQVSPGINVSESDNTTTTPAIATTTGAFAGVFGWGPIGKLFLINSENNLIQRYGKPTNSNYETFFTAANFLSYGNALYVSRAGAVTGVSNTVSAILSSNSTVVVQSNTTGIAVGFNAYGAGIPANTTVVTATINGANTNVVLSTNATATTTASVNFSDPAYVFNAVANSQVAVTRASYLIPNQDALDTVSIAAGVEYVARFPGGLGNSLKISQIDNASQYASTIDPYNGTYTGAGLVPANGGISIAVNATVANVFMVWDGNSSPGALSYANVKLATTEMLSKFTVGDYVQVGNSTIGTQYLKVKTLDPAIGFDTITTAYFNVTFETPYTRSTNFVANTIARKWEFFNAVTSAPGTSAGASAADQVSIVVADSGGLITGVPGTVLEVYQNLSRATDAKLPDGTANYYKTVINNQSDYAYNVNDRSTAPTATLATVAAASGSTPYTKAFIGGTDGKDESSVSVATLAKAYDLYADATQVDISLVLAGKAINGTQVANYLIDNIAEARKDCVVFISPQKSDVVNATDPLSKVLTFANTLRPSSYSVRDSGYKYQYDKYSDVYRYVPLNGDIAGVTARTDNSKDPWWSPAGFNRGQILNVIKLAWNPTSADRDFLYNAYIDPVVTFPGQGTILYGDKTGLGHSSAFDRINVRRLFIVLEKTIATAAKSALFDFNDAFTQAQFKNIVEPFLRDVQGRRGIYDFRVVCDETNNTPDVVDSDRFIGDIYIKPARSINFIQLNFVAVRSGVEFTEIVGQF